MHNEPRSGELCIGNHEGLCICQIHPMDPLGIGIPFIFTIFNALDIVFLTFQNVHLFYALGLLKEVLVKEVIMLIRPFRDLVLA